MSTHIEAMPGQIAKTVIMPGDPKRAQYMASKFLEDLSAFLVLEGY